MSAWNRRQRYLTTEEVPPLLAALKDQREHLRPIVVLALMTGMRLGALLGLKWEHVNFGSASIFIKVKNRTLEVRPDTLLVEKNKMGDPYTVPLNRVALKLL